MLAAKDIVVTPIGVMELFLDLVLLLHRMYKLLNSPRFLYQSWATRHVALLKISSLLYLDVQYVELSICVSVELLLMILKTNIHFSIGYS